METWEDYPIVFITSNGNAWDPHKSHFAENEAVMLVSNGLIIEHNTQPPRVVFTEADLSKLYGKPVAWDEFNNAINAVYTSDNISLGYLLTEDELVQLDHPDFYAKLASLGVGCKPSLFAALCTECANLSHAAMALGSMLMDDNSCENFEATMSALLATAFATISAVSVGRSKGVNVEHLDKV